jgi:hypothetical protein
MTQLDSLSTNTRLPQRQLRDHTNLLWMVLACLLALCVSGCATVVSGEVGTAIVTARERAPVWAPAEANRDVALHACTKNPFMRAVGLFGGDQPEIFLTGTDLRHESPPAPDGLTRVFNVTEVENFRDPGADPDIDKCGSWLQSRGENEVELTILWQNRDCSTSFAFDDEDSDDCSSRTSFRFSLEDLGMQEVRKKFENLDAALQSNLVVDAYFTQELQPDRRRSATGMPTPPTGVVHLVARLGRAPQ